MPFFLRPHEDPETLFIMGDSKATAANAWIDTLLGKLNATAGTYDEHATNWGFAGETVALMETRVAADLAAVSGDAEIVLLNLGANDSYAVLTEATWKASLTSIIDALIAKWSGVKIYVTKAWTQAHPDVCADMAGWIDAVIATYGSNVYIGTDEIVWLENGDDGATYTSDGVHYSAAGQTENANQWTAVIT